MASGTLSEVKELFLIDPLACPQDQIADVCIIKSIFLYQISEVVLCKVHQRRRVVASGKSIMNKVQLIRRFFKRQFTLSFDIDQMTRIDVNVFKENTVAGISGCCEVIILNQQFKIIQSIDTKHSIIRNINIIIFNDSFSQIISAAVIFKIDTCMSIIKVTTDDRILSCVPEMYSAP